MTGGFDPQEQHALLEGDLEDKTGLYASDKHGGLKMIYRSSQVHNSLVTLTFTADSVAFVENRLILDLLAMFLTELLICAILLIIIIGVPVVLLSPSLRISLHSPDQEC